MTTVEVAVTEEVAERWQTLPEIEKKRLSLLVQAFVLSARTPAEAFTEYLDHLGSELEANGLTDEIVDEELAAYRAERRS